MPAQSEPPEESSDLALEYDDEYYQKKCKDRLEKLASETETKYFCQITDNKKNCQRYEYEIASRLLYKNENKIYEEGGNDYVDSILEYEGSV